MDTIEEEEMSYKKKLAEASSSFSPQKPKMTLMSEAEKQSILAKLET